jgi:hypothetical protein
VLCHCEAWCGSCVSKLCDVRRRTFTGVPSPSRREIDLTEFPERFMKSSQRVLERMAVNAKAMKVAFMATWRKINGRDRSEP